MTSAVTLQKLEWPLLVENLAAQAQSEEGRETCLALEPKYDREATENRWVQVDPLRRIASQGYRPPIGALMPMGKIFRAVEVGQTLVGPELRRVYEVLLATRQVYAFAGDFSEKCPTLRPYKALLYLLPVLVRDIERAVSPDGELLDTASEELTRIRRAKVSMRARIENHIRKVLHEQEMEAYLQDDFFTVRNERYVVPIRIDGRGRVKGTVIDTSASGQTLFMEPESVAPLNAELLELDVSEKLEIIRIFRNLTSMISKELDVIRQSYGALIELDIISAEAMLAHLIGAGPITLVDPGASGGEFDLIDARHPLIKRDDGAPPVPTTVALGQGQRCLIVSGPNAGGKTVVLKTIGLLHLMAKARLLVPAAPQSKMALPRQVFLELGDSQSLTANLSTFSGHIAGLRPILQGAGPGDIVLLDELATGTDPQTGAAIAQSILENLATRSCLVVSTTHFEPLKSLAITDSRFRNGSMEYQLKTLTPTYRLIMDVPGQSFGLEVAEKMGLPPSVVERAKALRGAQASSLDEAVRQLTVAREEALRAQTDLDKERLGLEQARLRFEEERDLIEETRRKTAEKLRQKYEGEMRELVRSFEESSRAVRSALTKWQGNHGGGPLDEESKSLLATQDAAQEAMKSAAAKLGELEKTDTKMAKLPGYEAEWSYLRKGVAVHIIPLNKKGEVVSLASRPEDGVQVRVGILEMRVPLHDLRLVSAPERAPANGPKPATPPKKEMTSAPVSHAQGSVAPTFGTATPAGSETNAFIPQTPTNTVDVRGMRADDGLSATWRFIDQAVMRGESHVLVIHGHGTERLKSLIRKELTENSPYELTFRAGEDQEGGDGVTIITLMR